MNKIKKGAVAVIGALSLILPLGLGSVAHAQEGPVLQCDYIGQSEFPEGSCDLSVDKLVSVNGGAYVEADTSADAAQAQVGDTITWKIIVSNSGVDTVPYGVVYVSDVLPSGVTYVSSSATSGTYETSGLFVNNWYLPLMNSDENTNLPATLIITSKSNATGLYENTATLAKYDGGSCDGGCIYSDDNSSNDSNSAWIDPSAKPQVLGTSTLANTGGGLAPSLIAGGLVAATLAVSFIGRRSAYKLDR